MTLGWSSLFYSTKVPRPQQRHRKGPVVIREEAHGKAHLLLPLQGILCDIQRGVSRQGERWVLLELTRDLIMGSYFAVYYIYTQYNILLTIALS